MARLSGRSRGRPQPWSKQRWWWPGSSCRWEMWVEPWQWKQKDLLMAQTWRKEETVVFITPSPPLLRWGERTRNPGSWHWSNTLFIIHSSHKHLLNSYCVLVPGAVTCCVLREPPFSREGQIPIANFLTAHIMPWVQRSRVPWEHMAGNLATPGFLQRDKAGP